MEDNRLIAEFMGLDSQILSTNNVHSWNDAPFYYITKDSKEKVMESISKYSKYHTSWDWLMPVVKRIVRDVELDVGYKDEYREHLMDVVPFAKIEDVHEAVVDFIKNQNN